MTRSSAPTSDPSRSPRGPSEVECLARSIGGRVPREVHRRSSASRGTSEVYRDPPRANRVSIRSLALATRPTMVRWSSASRGTSEVYRDHERGVSRPALGEPGLDTLAGARYSTNDSSEVECLARSIGGRVPREGRARCIETTSEVYRDPPRANRVSIRSLALATRPTNRALATRPTNGVLATRPTSTRSLLDRRTRRSRAGEDDDRARSRELDKVGIARRVDWKLQRCSYSETVAQPM